MDEIERPNLNRASLEWHSINFKYRIDNELSKNKPRLYYIKMYK